MFSVERIHYVYCFLLKVLNTFSVEGTQYVSCCRYSIRFLLKVLITFSVEGTQYVFC